MTDPKYARLVQQIDEHLDTALRHPRRTNAVSRATGLTVGAALTAAILGGAALWMVQS